MNKYLDFMNKSTIMEIILEKSMTDSVAVNVIDVVLNEKKDAWIVNAEYTYADGTRQKTKMTFNEFEATGDDPNVKYYTETIREYLSARFFDYSHKLYDYIYDKRMADARAKVRAEYEAKINKKYK